MRYFEYVEPDDTLEMEPLTIRVSEDDIRREYYPYWYERMCEKFGKKLVDESYTFNDCLDDWMITNWAWEIDCD
jgi:hypothetical protein